MLSKNQQNYFFSLLCFRNILLVVLFLSVVYQCSAIRSKKPSDDEKESSIENELQAQWACEMKPGVNPQEVANRLGFDYEGKHSSLPNVHLLRLKKDYHSIAMLSRKIQDLKNAKEIVWSEVQRPHLNQKRPTITDI